MSSDARNTSNRNHSWSIPTVGGDPSSFSTGTTPGSFANAMQLGGALTFSSPDTPNMPPPSDKTAWDFMPADLDADEAVNYGAIGAVIGHRIRVRSRDR